MVKAGYKQTEVGVIPEDWDVKTLGLHIKITSGESPSKYRFTDEGNPYYKVEQLGQVKKYLDQTPYLFKEGTLVPKNSIAFPKRGASILSNNIRVFSKDAFMDTNVMAITLIDNSFYHEFLYYYLVFKGLSQYADTTSIPQINNKHINPIKVFKPSLKEQIPIATALSDVDALITSLTDLIDKKRQIKTATMQQLLTGKQRLAGFGEGKGMKQTELGEIPEDWEVIQLGGLGYFSKGRGIKKDEAQSGEIPCIRYGEIYTYHNDIVRNFNSHISEKVAKTSYKLRSNSLLFAGSGETKEEIGKCVAFISNQEVYAGGDIVIQQITKGVVKFLGYLLNTPLVVKQKANRGQGDAVVHISSQALSTILIMLPPEPEQQAIAQVLSNMDDDLNALETRLTKTKAIKQGMMQELLTGRIRLV